MAKKLTASFSNRVAIRRHSLSQPTQHSMMLLRRYAWRSNFNGRPLCRPAWSDRWGITAPTECRRSHLRIRSMLYALSPVTRFGRERGRPRGCGILTAFISCSNWVDSCRWPGVAATARGNPLPSVTMCSFVPNPPLERPRAWSRGSREPPFDRRRRPRGWPGSLCRRYTTGPTRCGPPDPDGPAGPGEYGPRFGPCATG